MGKNLVYTIVGTCVLFLGATQLPFLNKTDIKPVEQQETTKETRTSLESGVYEVRAKDNKESLGLLYLDSDQDLELRRVDQDKDHLNIPRMVIRKGSKLEEEKLKPDEKRVFEPVLRETVFPNGAKLIWPMNSRIIKTNTAQQYNTLPYVRPGDNGEPGYIDNSLIPKAIPTPQEQRKTYEK